jgi:uncharacterized protein YjbI with pentapeptide repeats
MAMIVAVAVGVAVVLVLLAITMAIRYVRRPGLQPLNPDAIELPSEPVVSQIRILRSPEELTEAIERASTTEQTLATMASKRAARYSRFAGSDTTPRLGIEGRPLSAVKRLPIGNDHPDLPPGTAQRGILTLGGAARRRPPAPARDDSSYERLDDPVLEDDVEWSESLIEGASLAGVRAQHVRLIDVRLRSVDLRDAVLPGIEARDCIVTDSDLANAACTNAAFTWVELVDSRATGLDLSESELLHVTFRDCKLDLASLRFAKLTDVELHDCALTGGDLTGAELTRVRFERCDLTGIDLSSARLDTVDVRTSTLASVRGVGALRGATVDAAQVVALAPSLAAELGIVVVEPDD